jgi:hypothetical protein
MALALDQLLRTHSCGELGDDSRQLGVLRRREELSEPVLVLVQSDRSQTGALRLKEKKNAGGN